MNIYEEMIKLGVQHAHHESDLYVPVNDATTKLVNQYEFKQNVKMFTCNIDKKLWYDIPFAYMPFWEKASRRQEIEYA